MPEDVQGTMRYTVQQFAEIAGVTVRALHHYDRLGLLKAERSRAGYRLYRERDLERLEQIIALRFIGVPLKQIRSVLDGSPRDLSAMLQSQLGALEEKQRRLGKAIAAVRDGDLRKIIEVMNMNDNSEWMLQYFSDEAKPKVEARRAAWTPELQAQAEKDWSDLFRDIRLALDEDPAGAKAQSFVDRWNDLIRQFTGGEAEVASGVKSLYADRAHWPEDFQTKIEPFTDPQVWEFFRKAVAARRAGK